MSPLCVRLLPSMRAPMRARVPALAAASRTITSSAVRRSDSHPPIIQGPGAAPGQVATDMDQSTGIERFEYLGDLNGIDVFDQEPLDASRYGTMKNPIVVPSMYPERIIGSTGFPADSFEPIWLTLRRNHTARCPRSGNVYVMNYMGDDDAGGH
ncbi:Cytochrome c oxidase subunit 4 [Malassezia sp. CBS 17886]|nr:Cytochrome c oxidase subunit 4 [Malassezia sp. CBS 17886]